MRVRRFVHVGFSRGAGGVYLVRSLVFCNATCANFRCCCVATLVAILIGVGWFLMSNNAALLGAHHGRRIPLRIVARWHDRSCLVMASL